MNRHEALYARPPPSCASRSWSRPQPSARPRSRAPQATTRSAAARQRTGSTGRAETTSCTAPRGSTCSSADRERPPRRRPRRRPADVRRWDATRVAATLETRRTGLRGRKGSLSASPPAAASASSPATATAGLTGHSWLVSGPDAERQLRLPDGVCRSHVHRAASQRSSGAVRLRGRSYLPGGEDFGDSRFRIRDDGTFEAEGTWDGPSFFRATSSSSTGTAEGRGTVRHRQRPRQRNDRHELRAQVSGLAAFAARPARSGGRQRFAPEREGRVRGRDDRIAGAISAPRAGGRLRHGELGHGLAVSRAAT